MIIFDNRGVGESDKPSGDYTTKEMAEDTFQLLKALKYEKASVLGYSMGGMIAQELAINHPEVVDKLILAGTCSEPSKFNAHLLDGWQKIVVKGGIPDMLKNVLLWCISPGFYNEREAEILEFEKATDLVHLSREAYLSQIACIRTHNTTARLGAIQARTLVLHAANDLLFSRAQQEQLLKEIKGSTSVCVDKGGHAFTWECPEVFNGAVCDFLQ
uniref:AB hydrolase-1 domain-containing protein n=1 Tax=Arcella intermedia TaxID=1963864 RepID=A0A6B2LHF1_9EUKA